MVAGGSKQVHLSRIRTYVMSSGKGAEVVPEERKLRIMRYCGADQRLLWGLVEAKYVVC